MRRIPVAALLAAVAVLLAVTASADDPTVYITKTGAKYHRTGCSSLSKSKIPIALSDAVAAGYTACARCNPPRSGASTSPPAQGIQGGSSSKPRTSGRCQAITKKGTQCSRQAKPGSSYCWQHGG